MIHYIKNAVSKGFDVEIDIWYDILDKNYLWVHCKNIESFFEFSYKADIDGKVPKIVWRSVV